MALVFTDEWLRKVRNRCERLPRSVWSPPQLVALSEKYDSLRTNIGIWVGRMRTCEQQKVIPRLRSASNFRPVLNELMLGSKLMDLGYHLAYERELDEGMTPDWYVFGRDAVPPFIVEFYTRNIPEVQEKQERFLEDLRSRLKKIPVGVVLSLELEDHTMILDYRLNKTITKKVRERLSRSVEPAPAGERLVESGVACRICDCDVQLDCVESIISFEAFWVDTIGMKERIQDKINKYGKHVLEAHVPFVIAVAADYRTALQLENFEDALFGPRTYSPVLDTTNPQRNRLLSRPRQGGLFTKSRALSGAIWLNTNDPNECTMTCFLNPDAENPLPEDTFL